MKKINYYLLFITFLLFGCAKPTSPVNEPNSFYYYAYAKYSITISDYINWNGLLLYPTSAGKFSLSYQSAPDFGTCLGLASYSTTNTEFFPSIDGEIINTSGNLIEPLGGCFNSIQNFSIKKIGVHLNVPFYELTLGAERYLIRTNK